MADTLRERAIEACARAIDETPSIWLRYSTRYSVMPWQICRYKTDGSEDDRIIVMSMHETEDEARRHMRVLVNNMCATASLDALRTFLAANAQMIVPVGPEQPMWAAGGDAVVGYKNRHHDRIVEAVWCGMLAASPDPLAPTEAEGE